MKRKQSASLKLRYFRGVKPVIHYTLSLGASACQRQGGAILLWCSCFNSELLDTSISRYGLLPQAH